MYDIQIGPTKTEPLLNKYYWNESIVKGDKLKLLATSYGSWRFEKKICWSARHGCLRFELAEWQNFFQTLTFDSW